MFINIMFAKLQTLTLLVIIFEHAFVNCLLIISTFGRKGTILVISNRRFRQLSLEKFIQTSFSAVSVQNSRGLIGTLYLAVRFIW